MMNWNLKGVGAVVVGVDVDNSDFLLSLDNDFESVEKKELLLKYDIPVIVM